MDMFKKITFVRFCFASAYVLPGDLGLPTENLICLYKECIEMAKHCNDIRTMMNCCQLFVLDSNSIGRHADSLRCLKEILPSDVVIPLSSELIVHKYLSLTYEELEDFGNVVLHARKWIEISRNIGNKDNERYGHYVLGNAFLSLTCYNDAIDCSKQYLEFAQETGSVKDEMNAYDRIRRAYKYMQKYDDTILYSRKLLDCAMKSGDKMWMKTAYLELGRAHLALNHYQDAIDFGGKCIEIAREIKDKDGEVWAYLLMGRIYNALPDYDSAIIYCKKCIELPITVGDKHAYSLLGDVYCSLGKYDDAISNCNECIDIDEEDKDYDASAYLTLGKVNQSLEKYDEAIENFKQCIDIVNSIGREKEAAVRACLYLGKIYQTLKQYNDAVFYSKKCIDMAQVTGERRIEAQASLRLMFLYLALDEKDNAIQYGKKCLTLSQETNDKKTQLDGHYFLAQVYLGSMQLNDVFLSIDAGMAIATELGDKDAEKNFKAIRSNLYAVVGLPDHTNAFDEPEVRELILLDDLDQAVRTGEKKKKYGASLSLYRFYLSKKFYGKTTDCLEQLKEMDLDRSVNLFCFTEIGNLYQLLGQKDMALRCFKEGLSTAESCSNNMLRSKFYYAFGNLLFLENKEQNLAESYLREAIRCFEAIFRTLGSRDECKISIFDQCIHSYKLLTILLINSERKKEALLVLDRCRARALKDLLVSNFKMEQEGRDDEHLEYSDVLSLVSTNDFSISYYSLCYDHLLKFFLGGETHSSFSFCPNYSPQKYVDTLFDEMGVREVVNCEDRSLDKEQDIQEEQKRGKEEYETLNEHLLNVDSKRGESNENSAETKGSTLKILFDILECDKIVSSKQGEVVVIPEGPLYQVPFSALRDPRTGKYLSQTKRMRLAPSLATLKHFEDFPRDQTSNAKPLIIGDPLVGKVMMDGEEWDIPRLPGALDEAAGIARMLGVRPLVAADATKPAVLEKLQQGVSIVHIAAHGSLNKGTIALAPCPEIRATKIPDEEDYMLTMADVQQAQVRAQLVVLSCCHSGRGEIRAEGVVGMCRAFLASGARAVVASLWAIDDQATLEFMQNFYLSLKEGKSASVSLQEAMEEMRNTSYHSEPKYWASFFLMGDDVTL